MKKFNIVLAIAMLVLASLACQTVAGGGSDPQVQPLPPVDQAEDLQEEPAEEEESTDEGFDFSFGADAEFPLPDDATNVTEVAGTVNYQTEMSVEDVMKFYRDAFTAQGYTERELLTTLSDGVLSMVFDGHESGQAIVVQSVDLGTGSTNVNIRLEDV